MWSFKLKLVLWFALLALLPLAVAFYGYDTLAKRSETRRVDAGLEAGLRGAVAAYGDRIERAGGSAQQLASDPALQRALRGRDRRTIQRILARVPGAHLGDGPGSVTVVDRGRVLGRIAISVPLNRQLLRTLARPLPDQDRLVALRAGRVVAGGSGRLPPPAGAPDGRPLRRHVLPWPAHRRPARAARGRAGGARAAASNRR